MVVESKSDTGISADSASILKAIVSILSEEVSLSMKKKELVGRVSETLGLESGKKEKKAIMAAIDSSANFTKDGKLVSLVSSTEKDGEGKKRKGDGDDSEEKKARKRAKKDKKKADKKEAKKKMKLSSSDTTTTTSDVVSWRKTNRVSLLSPSGDDLTPDASAHPPILSFADAGLPPSIASHFSSKGWKSPTPIQCAAWPILGSPGYTDVVGIAETGSGKTLAFAIPAIISMVAKGKTPRAGDGRKPSMLVLAPTRELAMQSQAVLEEVGGLMGLVSVTLYGGVSKYDQIKVLRSGVDMVVATPGRLRDLADDGKVDLSKVTHLVLDEADRMLDMGFEEEVQHIISLCPDRDGRRTAMFSATWPASVQAIAMTHMRNPVRVYVGFESIVGSGGGGSGTTDDSLSANKRVKQYVEVHEDRAREVRLRSLLSKIHKGNNRVLIFALYKKEAARLESTVRRWGHNVGSIHGDKLQAARTAALQAFRDGSCPLLVATDVAARGLDIPNVTAVVNYTFPLTIEDYVHRIGRTGRAGKTGDAYTFFQPGDKSHAGELQQVLKQAGQDVPEALLAFGSTIKKKEHKLYGNFGPRMDIPMKKATKITFDDWD